MKKSLFFVLFLTLFFCFPGASPAWQGKMAGMGDPYGLMQDESDLLIHPALITRGDGVNIYGHYRYTATDIDRYDYELEFVGPATPLTNEYDLSGDEDRHDALVGTAFPLGPGRMGVFAAYEHVDKTLDGDWDLLAIGTLSEFDMDTDVDNYDISLVYGLPLGSMSLALEGGVDSIQEESEFQEDLLIVSNSAINWPTGSLYPLPPIMSADQFLYMVPCDSEYREGYLKGSISKEPGPMSFSLTLHGGMLFDGDNEYRYDLPGTPLQEQKLEGDVDGFSLGGDLWLRPDLGGGLSLPFLLGADYRKTEKDGTNEGTDLLLGLKSYEHTEKELAIEAGGGLHKAFSERSSLGGGLYYGYMDGETQVDFDGSLRSFYYDHYPDWHEHRVTLRVAGETGLTSSFTLRAGVELFYGSVTQEFALDAPQITYSEEAELDGHRLGGGFSLGGSIDAGPVCFEPFANVSYQALSLEGDGSIRGSVPGGDIQVDGGLEQDLFVFSTGLSILF